MALAEQFVTLGAVFMGAAGSYLTSRLTDRDRLSVIDWCAGMNVVSMLMFCTSLQLDTFIDVRCGHFPLITLTGAWKTVIPCWPR